MPPPPDPVALPESYAALKFNTIQLSHHPDSSPSPTQIIVLTLFRPKQYNAFTREMAFELERVFQMISLDDRVKCCVMTGTGRMFCAGLDLEVGFKVKETETEHRDEGGQVALAIHHCQKPVIGALQGPAVGVGITMTLPMTIRVALRSAKIGFVFARRALVTEACSSFFLPRLIGMSRALHVVSTGATYRADSTHLDGLFTELCDAPEQVLPKAIELAQEIADKNSSPAVYLSRQLMWRNPGTAEDTHLLDSRVMYGLRMSQDNTEGVASFLEKRPAKFTGTMADSAPNVYPWWTPVDTKNRVKAQGMGPAKL